MKPEEIESASQIGALVQLKPYLDRELDSIQHAIYGKIRNHVLKGTLTPEISQAEWLAWSAAETLRHRFASKITSATSTAARIAPSL